MTNAPEKDKAYHELYADETAKGLRLDQFLSQQLADYSRSFLKKLIMEEQVKTRDGQLLTNPSLKLKEGQNIIIAIPPPKPATPIAEQIPLHIIYEDEDLIIINKPVGMVVHPAPGNHTGTLVNALLYHAGHSLSGIGGVARPGIVHRLDKDTSGIMVVAKHDKAHRGLAAQFADHGRTGPLKRAYEAIVWGAPQPVKGKIDIFIGRSPKAPLKQAVLSAPKGKHAITHYQLLKAFHLDGEAGSSASHVECQLETGRTHQIRVAMAHIGHPLLGDPLYGTGFKTKINKLPPVLKAAISKLNFQALHAKELGFEHPVSGKTLHFTAPLPQTLQKILTLFNETAPS